MDDLIAFLTARVDDAERCVYSEGDPPNGVIAWLTYREPDGSMSYTTVAHGRTAAGPWTAGGRELAPPASVLVVHDPARVLREVEAKRRILARYEDCLARMEDPAYPQSVAADQAREYEDFVLPNLAAVYSDHADFRSEWTP